MGKIPVTIPGIFKGILPIPMYPFMYNFYEASCFVYDFMELIPQETQKIFLCTFKEVQLILDLIL